MKTAMGSGVERPSLRHDAAPAGGAGCWVCGGELHPFWKTTTFDSVACRRCGHVVAEHHPGQGAGETDYHLGYDQHEFVAALRATRRRQAARLLDALGELAAPPRSVFDFGCGRGFFLEVAAERGGLRLAGGDVSELALELLAKRGLPALRLDTQLPFERLRLAELPFIPEVITFLDVIEHFPGDLRARLQRWLLELHPGVRYVVLKVPVRDGLLFSFANLARRGGVDGFGRQLFQSGTYPPHYQYFTRRSLDQLVLDLGLEPRAVLDDLDFEPPELGRRLASRGRAIRALAPALGMCLGAVVRATGRMDSRIVIAERVA
jgi:SAM-dependent methyltransferase